MAKKLFCIVYSLIDCLKILVVFLHQGKELCDFSKSTRYHVFALHHGNSVQWRKQGVWGVRTSFEMKLHSTFILFA